MKKQLLTVLAALLPALSFAQPANDNCANAIELSVSSTTTFTTVNGTTQNATASGGAVACTGVADDDVWYKFTATATRHAISTSAVASIAGAQGGFAYEVYNGSCSGSLVLCAQGTTNAIRFADNLTIGTTYYIRVFTTGGPTPLPYATFTLGVATPGAAISVTDNEYTAAQLVEDIFTTPTVTVSNVTFSTGSSFNASYPNGIGYFEQNGSDFLFENGIVLSTGKATQAVGPNGNDQHEGIAAWPGDTNLNTILASSTSPNTTTINATVLEFDFVPNDNIIKFNYVFASEEYGSTQCYFYDGMAVLLTDTETGYTTNLAVVPGTVLPISAPTINNALYSNVCISSSNPQYFGAFYEPVSLQGATNFNGQTVQFTAEGEVVAGQTYHLKIAVADWGDPVRDSAIFLKGGSLTSGLLFDDSIIALTESTFVMCADELNPNLAFDLSNHVGNIVQNPWSYTFNWFATLEDAQNNLNPLPIYYDMQGTEQTVYLRVKWVGNNAAYDIVNLHLLRDWAPATTFIEPVYVCDNDTDGFTTIDLTAYTTDFAGPDTEAYTVQFYPSYEDAQNFTNAITNPGAYTNTSNPQTIFAWVTSTSVGGCMVLTNFSVNVQSPPQVEPLAPIAFCLNGMVDATAKVNALANLDSFGFITYHTTQADANAGINALTNPQAFSVGEQMVSLWVRIESPTASANNAACYTVAEQKLIPWINFMYVETQGTTATVVMLEGLETFEFTFMLNGQPVAPGVTVFENLDYGTNSIYATNTTCNYSFNMSFPVWPPAPTGQTQQNFTEGETLASLEAEGTGIQWFNTPTGGNQLPETTPLEDGITYYAGQYINNYVSLERLGVTANLVAGITNNSLATLQYYPNPVKHEVTLQHSATLLSAVLYNALGQEVLNRQIGTTTATLNMAHLANGIYLLKVTAEDGSRTLKLVKE